MDIEVKIKWDFPSNFGTPMLLISFGNLKMSPIQWEAKESSGSFGFKTSYKQISRLINIWTYKHENKVFRRKLDEKTKWLKNGSNATNCFKVLHRGKEIMNMQLTVRLEKSLKTKKMRKNLRYADRYGVEADRILANYTNTILSVTSRNAFDVNKKKTFLSCFAASKNILFDKEIYENIGKHLLEYYSIVDGDKKLNPKKTWPDFVAWIPTKVHTYIADITNGDYVRSWYPLKSGNCNDLPLTMNDCYKGLMRYKFDGKLDELYINVKYHASLHYPCLAVLSTTGNSPTSHNSYTSEVTYHEMKLFLRKDVFEKKLRAFRIKKGGYCNEKQDARVRGVYEPGVVIGEATAMVTGFWKYKPKLKMDRSLCKRLEYKDMGFRAIKYGKDLNYYKKVYQIMSDEFIEEYGTSSFYCMYNGHHGVPFNKFLGVAKGVYFVKSVDIRKNSDYYKYAKFEAYKNHPIPTKEFIHIDDNIGEIKNINKMSSFVETINSNYSGEKLIAVGYYSVEDLLVDGVRSKIMREIKNGYKFNFKRQDLKNSGVNRMTTIFTKIWK